MASQSVLLKAAGLQTFYQTLMEIPPGALLKADNSVINKPGVIEPRRGIKAYGSAFPINTDRAKQLLEYKGRIIRHINNKLAYDDGTGVFTDFLGDYLEPVSGFRIKGVENKSNFYITTSEGVKRLSSSSSSFTTDLIQDSGAPKAIAGNTLINFITTGFLSANSEVAYRIAWTYTDANSNFYIGSPSSRMVIANTSTTNDASVDLTIPIPYNVTDQNYKYRIYRSEIASSLPSDELYQVYEGTPTTAELSAGVINYTDSLSDTLRLGGVPLYTNQYSGEGALKSNEPPPSARDIALFKGHQFYANTRSRHYSLFNLTDVTGFTSGSSNFIITDGTTTHTYTFYGAKEKSQVTVTLNHGSTIPGSYFILYSASNKRKYKVWLDKTGTDTEPTVAGTIAIRVNLSGGGISTTTDVAVAIKNQINTSAGIDFIVTNLANVLTIENTNNGVTTDTADGTTTYTFSTLTQGQGEDASTQKVLLSADVDVDTAIEETALSLVRVINAQAGEIVNAFYLSNQDSAPGQIYIQRKSLEDTPFYIGTSDSSIQNKFNPALGLNFTNTTVSIANPTVITTSGNHGRSINNYVFIYGATTTASINGKQKITAVPALNQYEINKNVTVATVNGSTMTIEMESKVDKIGNRLYYSKYLEPEAVPFLNYVDIGSRDQEILRIIALRESLFILKGDGVFRLAGDPGVNPIWDISVFDNTSIIKAPDTAVTLNNNIYFFGNQGVVKLNESTIEPISRPIEDKLIPFISTNSNLAKASFSVGYESDRALLMWTVQTKLDTIATVCYRYNIYTETWTEWRIAKTCSVLNIPEDKLYFGSGVDNYVEIERKNFDRFDYADREIASTLAPTGLINDTIKPSNFTNLSVGDVISQTQYVTIYQFNMLLKKLDLDNGLVVHGFYDELKMDNGDSLTTKMVDLVVKLNIADPNTFTDTNGNTSYVFSGTTVFSNIQNEFNEIVERLNESPTTYFDNYVLSSGTIDYETIVMDLDTIKKEAYLNNYPVFMVGPLTFYKAINCDIEYAPQHAGDPSTQKQFSDGTFMFERRSFYTATVGYNSDISDNYETIDFVPNNSGIFGVPTWGDGTTWGGLGDQAQIRTYIPLKKQRCRFLGCKFNHNVALESFELYGLALTVRGYAVPQRAYK